MKSFDIIIMVKKKNVKILGLGLPYIRRYIKANRIVCIGNANLKDDIEKMECVFLDEDIIFPELSYSIVKEIIEKLKGDASRTGWYFQQFLKMKYASICEDDYYIVWDSDTIPLRNIEYFEGNKFILMTKSEFHKPYFDTIQVLFGGDIGRMISDSSFIAENMIINKNIMEEIIEKIEANDKIEGQNFFEKILYSIDTKDLSFSGFSEFETYGNYVLKHHADKLVLIKRRALRIGAFLCGYYPNDKQLKWLSQYYDLASFENKSKNIKNVIWATWFSIFTRLYLFRTIFRPQKIAVFCFKLMKLQARLRGRKISIDYDIE